MIEATCVDMTDTIVSFAKPLLDIIPPNNEEQLANFFDRVIEVWNAWVASSSWNDSRGIDDLADALANNELNDAEMYIQRVLAERFVMEFRTDGRLIIDWGVTIEDGVPVFRCAGCTATPELIAMLKDPPN